MMARGNGCCDSLYLRGTEIPVTENLLQITRIMKGD